MQAFVSEYAVTDPSQKGGTYGTPSTFGGALAEAAFLLSLERNRHVLLVLYYVSLLYHSIASSNPCTDLTIESLDCFCHKLNLYQLKMYVNGTCGWARS